MTNKLRQYVRKKKLRWTSQREIIAQALFKADQHLTTEQLFQKLHRKNPEIGYATVARTLHLLVDAGLCEKIDISDGSIRYEAIVGSGHHDHLICTQCGRFIEVYSPELEKVQGRLVKKYGFLEKSHKLQIFGVCIDCQKNSKF